MDLRTVRRGVAALATAAILGFAGANPAVAAELGWFERGLLWVSGLWAAEDAGAMVPEEPHAVWALDEIEKGMGLDPNGGDPPPPPPVETQ